MRSFLLVAALLPGCSVPYLVEARHLERARELLGQRARVAIPAEREGTGRRVHLDASAIYDRATPLDGGLALVADPPRAPQPLVDGRVRVRARPHFVTRMGIAHFVAGLALAAIGGIAWATHDDPCASSRQFICLDFGEVLAQALVAVGGGSTVAGAILWTVGEATRPDEIGPARARYTYLDGY